MTPQQIAREAAENYFPAAPKGEAHYRECDVDELSALILSAATKMVQQTGIEEALRGIRNSAGEQVMVCSAEGHSECVHRANAALQSLRTLTDYKGGL